MTNKIRTDLKIVKIVLGAVTFLLALAYTVSSSAQVASATLPDAPSPNPFTYDTGQAQQAPQKQTPSPSTPANPTQTSPNSGALLSLGDLGLTPDQIQGNAQAQALLDKRTHGLLTTIPLAATLFASSGAPCKKNCSNTAGADFHAALGTVTVGMYAATAYYAIAAPKITGTEKKGAIRWHEALVWIHGPGMILTPILGAIALNQQNNGQKVHGIASAHSAVAFTTAAAYGVSIVAVSWPIKVKFWEHQ